MTCAYVYGCGAAGQVKSIIASAARFGCFAEGVDMLSGEILEFVEGLTEFAFLFGGNMTEIVPNALAR